MKKILFALAFFFVFLSSASIIFADNPRLAECDMCGYCRGRTKPTNWPDCVKCIYPPGSEGGDGNITLTINESTNRPPDTVKGKYYTQLGCLNTNLSDFTQGGAAGSTVDFLLNRLLFPLSGAIAFVYLLYGGFIIATSQDDAEKLAYGKRVITGAIIGLLFVLFSVLIVSTISSGILKIPGFKQVKNENTEQTAAAQPTPTRVIAAASNPTATTAPTSGVTPTVTTAPPPQFSTTNFTSTIESCYDKPATTPGCSSYDLNHNGTIDLNNMSAWARGRTTAQ